MKETFFPEEISVVLSCYAQEELAREYGSLKNLRDSISSPGAACLLKDRINSILAHEKTRKEIFQRISVPGSGIGVEIILQDRSYLERVSCAVVEKICIGEDTDMLRIEPEPIPAEAVKTKYNTKKNYGLIFGAESLLIQDTVLAFQSDEINSRNEGSSGMNVLGVHYSWRTQDGTKTNRALIVDEKTFKVRDVVFSQPVRLDIIQTVHLPRKNEKKLHEAISRDFSGKGIIEINQFEGAAERADDKMQAYRLLTSLNGKEITPLSGLIRKSWRGQKVLDEVKNFVRQVAREKKINGSSVISVVAQPNTGTEGIGVRKTDISLDKLDSLDAGSPFIRHILDNILNEDDAIIREEKGSLYYYSPEQKERGYRKVVFRINVSYNGSGFSAESWYAHSAKDEKTFVTSPSCGGSVLNANDIIKNLYHRNGRKWKRFIFTRKETARLLKSAECAAMAVNEGLPQKSWLKMAGIDVIPEVNKTGLAPLVLDINPRPAGLARLKNITAGMEMKSVPKISYELFRWLKN